MLPDPKRVNRFTQATALHKPPEIIYQKSPMEKKIPLTKNCIEPWKSLLFGPDGAIIPCCGSPLPAGDFGNINNVDFEQSDTDAARAVFSCEAYRNLRRQLLEGTLQEACQGCRVVSEYVSPDQLLRRVVDHLRYGGRKITESADLTTEFAFTDCFTNVTDKCNFSCIYCFTHSNDRPGEGIKKYSEIEPEQFLKIISFLVANRLEYLNFCGVGELTIYPRWRELCQDILIKYPDLKLSLVSNFGRRYTDAELDVLLRFFQIRISCDTLNPEKYAWLRPGGHLPLVLENVDRLIAGFRHGSDNPKLFFIITESDAMLDGVTDLARFAVARNISLYFSNLSLIESSLASKTNAIRKIVDLTDAQLLHAWEILHDIPRRLQAVRPPMDFICDLGPLYGAVRSKAEAVTLNLFMPSEGELIYQSFAVAYPANPDVYLRKLFLSFDDCVKGIFLRSGIKAEVDLPYASGVIGYRIIWCRDVAGKSLRIYAGRPSTVVVGERLVLSAVKCPQRFTHVLFEIQSYEPGAGDKPAVHALDASLILPVCRLATVAEYPDRRYESAMAISEALKAYPVLHKCAEKIYRYGMRVLSKIKRGKGGTP